MDFNFLSEKTKERLREYNKEQERIIYKLNTNDAELVCENPEDLDMSFDIRLMTPMISLTQISGRDLCKVKCTVPNRKNKINVINKLLKYKIDYKRKENIIIVLNSGKYYFEDAIAIEHFLLESDLYKENSNVNILNLLNYENKMKEMDAHVKKIIKKDEVEGKRTIIITPSELLHINSLYHLDAIIISSVWNDIDIHNKFDIKIRNLVFETDRVSRGGSLFKDHMELTRRDLMIFEFKLSSLLLENKDNKPVNEKDLLDLKSTISLLDKTDIDRFGGVLVNNIYLKYGIIKINISPNLELTTKDVLYYNLDYSYSPFKEVVPPAHNNITKTTCMCDNHNNIIGEKGIKNLAPGPTVKTSSSVSDSSVPTLDSIYESLMKEYVQITTDTPTDREARHAVLAMIKDVKEMMK